MSLFSYRYFSEGQMFAGQGSPKVKEEAGWTGMDFTGGLCKTFPVSHEPVSEVMSPVQEELLSHLLSPGREAAATEMKGRTTDLCYPETMRGNL